jgi:hypothetical protein
MNLKRVPFSLASEDHGIVLDRTAGVLTLVGCGGTVLAAFLPWLERAVFGISLTTSGIQVEVVVLVVLALGSAGIAGVSLLRHHATRALAIILAVLAVAQLALAISNAVNVVHALDQAAADSMFSRLIGTGVYGCIVGSAVTLFGGYLAWTRRASPTDPAFSSGR